MTSALIPVRRFQSLLGNNHEAATLAPDTRIPDNALLNRRLFQDSTLVRPAKPIDDGLPPARTLLSFLVSDDGMV